MLFSDTTEPQPTNHNYIPPNPTNPTNPTNNHHTNNHTIMGYKLDALTREKRELLTNSRAYQEFLDAKAAIRKWRAQGMGHWATQWEAYAFALMQNPTAPATARPRCVHQPGETLRMQRNADGQYVRMRRRRERPGYLSGVSALGSKL